MLHLPFFPSLTLIAQPRCKGGTSKLAKSSSGGVSRPLRDLSLQGVAVASSSELCNSRLGLVAAVSQRQGSRGSQEDRAIILPDVSLALVGKVMKGGKIQLTTRLSSIEGAVQFI